MTIKPGPVRNIIRLLLAVMLASGSLAARGGPRRYGRDALVAPFAIATGLPDAARPALAYTPDGKAHAMWESEGTIYYAVHKPGAAWTEAVRVAAGLSPSLALDSKGVLHAVFANQFLGDYDIFHVTLRDNRWSLPISVSRTYGVSASPVLAAGPDGAYMQPGWTTRRATGPSMQGAGRGGFWSSNAIPPRQSPSIAVSPQGVIFVAWQDRLPRRQTRPACSKSTAAADRGAWTLAINVSDAPATDSIGAHVTVTPNGFGHLTWVDGEARCGMRLAGSIGRTRRPWSKWPVRPAATDRTTNDTRLHIAWDEGDIVRVSRGTLSWGKPEVIPRRLGDLEGCNTGANDDRGRDGRLGAGLPTGEHQHLCEQPGNRVAVQTLDSAAPCTVTR